MSVKNSQGFTQFGRNYSVNIATASGGSLTVPTNTGLLFVAGPDGADIWQMGAIATATQTSANTLEFFTSADFGATFSALPMTGAFAASAAVAAAVNIALPNTVPGGPTNPLLLGGSIGAFTHAMQSSALTESASWFCGQYPSAGTVNAQTIAQCYNTAQTAYGVAQVQGRMIDFTAGLTNSGAMTLAVGGAAAVAVTTSAGSALAGNEVTKGFRYRVIDTGSSYILLPTQRLYVAMTQSQGVTVTAWGADR